MRFNDRMMACDRSASGSDQNYPARLLWQLIPSEHQIYIIHPTFKTVTIRSSGSPPKSRLSRRHWSEVRRFGFLPLSISTWATDHFPGSLTLVEFLSSISKGPGCLLTLWARGNRRDRYLLNHQTPEVSSAHD